jgi:hypothetical protein
MTDAMYYGADDILSDFEWGQYEQAVFGAIKIAEEDDDLRSRNACKLFLKEFYPLMLREDDGLSKFKDARERLTEGFLPEKDYSNNPDPLLWKLSNLARGRYADTGNEHWHAAHEAILNILGVKTEHCHIITRDEPRVCPEPAADPNFESAETGTAKEPSSD